MKALRSDIERALDDMILNEEWTRFQSLAVVLAKLRWPEFIACERKKDLGADAMALAPDRSGKVLACSLTATIEKIKSDATKIKAHFPDIAQLVFMTPRRVTNTTAEEWAVAIRKEFKFELVMVPREDIISSLLGNASLCQANLGISVTPEAGVTELAQKVREANADVIATWSGRLAGNPFIELRAVRISPDGRDTGEAFHLSDIRAALAQSRRLVIEAPAGCGKTTTLAYLASEHSSSGGLAFVVDLPGWIKAKMDMLPFIAGRRAFQSRSIDADALARLSSDEHFCFFLNGWNEIAESDSPHAVEALRLLDQDFPSAGILVATRANRIIPSRLIPGSLRVRLRPVDRAQRTQYLWERLGPRSKELISKLDGDPVLNELTRTPLILSEVAALFDADSPIPATKMGVIEAAMGRIERTPEQSSHLQAVPLSGRAKEYLIDLANVLTERGDVEIAEGDARVTVSAVSSALRDAGQINSLPDQSEILDALCKFHVLEPVEYPTALFRFAHQQFQEFYAALFVKRKLQESLNDTAGKAGQQFTRRYINEPGWSEPLRMIGSELGAANASSVNAVSTAKTSRMLVEMALDTDCVFASELFRLCNVPAESPCAETLSQRLRFLYQLPDDHFREFALAGMIESGSDLFADIVLPLLRSSNQQTRLGTYRLRDGIYVSSLGPDWQQTVRGWEEDARAEFFSELLHFGTAPRAMLPFALADDSPKVHAVAISAMDWLGAHDELARALTTADASTFLSAVEQLPEEDFPVEMRSRALAGYESRYRESVDPSTRLQIVLRIAKLGGGNMDQRFKEDLTKYDHEKIGESWRAVIKPVLDIVQRTDPEWVSRWVADRLADDSIRGDDWKLFVTTVPPELKEGLLRRLETEDFKHVRHPHFVDLLATAADSAMVERIFVTLCGLRRTISLAPAERHEFEWAIEGQLEELFRALPADVRVIGLSARFSGKVELNELAVVTRLFGAIGREDFDVRSPLRDDLRLLLRSYLKRGAQELLHDESRDTFLGRQIGNLVSALAKVGEPEDLGILQALIRADIQGVREEREAAARARAARQRHANPESCSSWNVRAVVMLAPDTADTVLLELLNEPEYERVAATALLKLARTEIIEPGFGKKKDYRELWEARVRLRPRGFNESRRASYSGILAGRVAALLDECAATKEPGPCEFRLRELTKVLAAFDAHGSTALILRVLSIPERVTSWWWSSLEILETLLFNGIVLPSAETLKWFNALLEKVRPHRYDSQQVGPLLQALCLLPFIDAPPVGIAKIGEVIADLKFFAHQLRGVAFALGNSRCNDALDLLRRLVASESDARQLGDEWINAVAALDSPESRQLLMSFVDPAATGLAADVSFDREDLLASRLAELARRHTGIEQRVLQLCTIPLSEKKRALLSKVIGYLGSSEAAVAGLSLIDDNSSPPVPYEIWKQIESTFVEHRSHGEHSNAYTPAPRSSNAIRNRIFEMATRDAGRKKSALSLLGQIELWRLQYGRPHGEPRNPALGSRFPWPPIDLGN